ncbi:MAG TPA: GFA family protein, partial [Rhodopila sp.]|nr:GFA family protein [Rhodopila sp.]
AGKEARLAFAGVAESGRVKQRRICPDCGVGPFGEPWQGWGYPGLIRVVRGGTLDDTTWLQPTIHFWTRSAQPWVVLPAGVTIHNTQPV